ncbi:MAG: isochorismatase family protein [Fimbriimonadaceae bacterium]
MSQAQSRLGESVLIVVDMQPSFLAPIVGGGAVLEACRFLAKCAGELGVPVLATEQYPERMGGTDPELATLLDVQPMAKMAFSAWGAPGFPEALGATGARQAVLCGIETPICVTQTALDLLSQGWEVFLATDALGARSEPAHEAALRRLVGGGAVPSQAESVVYEWMGSASHPKFRDVLGLVKSRP